MSIPFRGSASLAAVLLAAGGGSSGSGGALTSRPSSWNGSSSADGATIWELLTNISSESSKISCLKCHHATVYLAHCSHIRDMQALQEVQIHSMLVSDSNNVAADTCISGGLAAYSLLMLCDYYFMLGTTAHKPCNHTHVGRRTHLHLPPRWRMPLAAAGARAPPASHSPAPSAGS